MSDLGGSTSVSTFGWFADANPSPPTAPVLSFNTSDADSVTLNHTAPSESDYATTTVSYGKRGEAEAGTTTGTGATIQVSGLEAATAYWFIAYATDDDGHISEPSNVVYAATILGTGQDDLSIALVQEAIEDLVDSPDGVYTGRRWPHNWHAPYSVLIRYESAEGLEGHGGVEQRRHRVVVHTRYKLRDAYGEDQQNSIGERALAIRNALHLTDPATFTSKPVGLYKIEVTQPIDIADAPEDIDVDYIETVIPVDLWTFETT